MTSEKGAYRYIKLPPGMYRIVFSLEGFQKVVRENVRVVVGKTTTENIAMNPVSLEESITVTAASPAVDVTSASLSTSLDKEQINNLPMSRYFFEVAKQLPGVTTRGEDNQDNRRISVLGSAWESNTIQVDGLDITYSSAGVPVMQIPQESVVEMNVAEAGVSTEYGSFTGAVINTVTKSGGNTFSGSFTYFGKFDKLTGDNNPDPEEAFSFHRKKFYDFSFTLGGPVIKDKLWFFANFDMLHDVFTRWKENPEYPIDEECKTFLAKLPFQLSDRHKVTPTFVYIKRNNQYPVTDTMPPEVTPNEAIATYLWNAVYTWFISNEAYAEARYGGFWLQDVISPIRGDINNPVHLDLLTGKFSGGPIIVAKMMNLSHQADANFSYFADDFLGEHEFKIGVQYDYNDYLVYFGYGQGRFYLDFGNQPFILYEQQPYYYGGASQAIGGFFNDSWKIGERLSVNFGFRFDHNRGFYLELPLLKDGFTKTDEIASPESDTLISWNTFTPRIGVAYQLTSDLKTLLKISAGRYYDKMLTGWSGPGPASTNWYYYIWNGVSWSLIYMVPGTGSGAEMPYVLDPDLTAPYSNQFQVGLARELFPDFSVEASFVYKHEANLIGWENRGGNYDIVDMVSPDNGKTYQVYNQTNVGTNQYWHTNIADFKQKYRGFILSFNKRYSNKWHMNTSLTYSKSDVFALGGGGTKAVFYNQDWGKDPNDWINADGESNTGRRWMFKFAGSYNFPLDILAGIYFSYMTGKPRPYYVRVFPDQGMRQILGEPRGSGARHNSLSMLDIRLQKSFTLYKSLKVHAAVDLFNILNTDTVIGYQSLNLWATNYLTPSAIPYPRRAQISIRVDF